MHKRNPTQLRLKKPITARFLGGWIVLLAGFAVTQSGLAEPRLTLDQALEKAASYQPLSRELAARVEGAEARKEQAGRWANPTFEVSQESVDAGGATTTERIYSLSQQFDFSGQKGLEARAAQVEAAGIRYGNDWRRLGHRGLVRSRFYATLLEQRRVKALRDALERMEEVVAMVKERRQADDISGYDQSRVERERAGLRARLDQANAALQYRRESLHVLLGTNEEHSGQRLAGELQPDVSAPLQTYMDRLDQRPDLKRLEASAESSELAQRAASRAWVPDPTVGVGLNRVEQPGADGGGLLLSVSLPLPVFNQGQAEAAEAAARGNEAEARRLRQLQEARARVRGLWRKTRSLIQSIETFRSEALARSRELTEFAESSYSAGEIGILELLDAYSGHLDARLRALEMAHEARVAAIELHQSSGGWER
ncbi:outer membrane protein TolC [Halospina denitrificans]|uniref:Outer membrane protein TolC n=1 Tax=Halospina denitrificans TaxID=332522 RepID=A0A4R7K2X6_9GAMM|nr:TolC family protein [Halospina denitrificans]TDT43919.1 outer membrane protein TolC [Halospina denitrificans]